MGDILDEILALQQETKNKEQATENEILAKKRKNAEAAKRYREKRKHQKDLCRFHHELQKSETSSDLNETDLRTMNSYPMQLPQDVSYLWNTDEVEYSPPQKQQRIECIQNTIDGHQICVCLWKELLRKWLLFVKYEHLDKNYLYDYIIIRTCGIQNKGLCDRDACKTVLYFMNENMKFIRVNDMKVLLKYVDRKHFNVVEYESYNVVIYDNNYCLIEK